MVSAIQWRDIDYMHKSQQPELKAAKPARTTDNGLYDKRLVEQSKIEKEMKIGIIVAMDKELGLLLNIVEDHKAIDINGYSFHIGHIEDVQVVTMTCGIGKVNAAMGTLTLIEHFHPDVVVNSGVAGGTGGGASILDVVLAKNIAYHDVWCGPGTQWGEATGCPRFFEPPKDAEAMAAALGTKFGLVASGDIFVSREEDVRRILALYPEAMAVDMESGAIAQVCYKKDVPMYCLRVVSDTPGAADNIAQYENFWSDAPRHTFDAVKALIAMLAK